MGTFYLNINSDDTIKDLLILHKQNNKQINKTKTIGSQVGEAR